MNRQTPKGLALAFAALLLSACGHTDPPVEPAEPAAKPEPAAAAPAAEQTTARYTVPVEYRKLDNGLKVVVSADRTAPLATVAVYYHTGLRNEPKGRTGFAHLFEHMMFQGSENLPKGEFDKLITGNGGILNGSTRMDFTNYFEVVPVHILESALWAEADRMARLDVTQENLTNQIGVVSNEVRVNVLNRPYGGFPWLDMPQYANENWYNAHNFYGDLEDLEAATLDDVRSFYETFYAPNNAVIAVVGDVDPAAVFALVEKHFGDIPARELPPPPDLTEPRQEQEKFARKSDPLAPRPALAFAYHVPERNTPEFYAMGLLSTILTGGEDSLLHQRLVQERGYAGGVSGGINLLGNLFNYEGPMLYTVSLIHDDRHTPEEIVAAADEVIDRLRAEPVDEDTLERALTKFRSSFYSTQNASFGFGRADLLASFALFDDDPGRINRIEDEMRAVTPALILATAKEHLRPTNRTVLVIEPGAATPPAAAGQEG
jgi:predicted Zn-dependent peptidase